MLSVRNTKSFKASNIAIWHLLFLSLCFFALTLCSCDRAARSGVNPGDIAPQLNLEDLQSGKSATLREFFGKKILLNFWASWCQPCADEMPELERLYNTLQGEDFLVIGVALEDDPDDLRRFLKKHPVSFPVLFEEAGSARKKYKLGGFPESYVLDSSGKISMIVDPQDGTPVAKIIGPRRWASKEIVDQLSSLP